MSEKRNTNWIIEQSKLLFGDSLDYHDTEYKDAKTKINFRCKKHDYTFKQTSNNHLNSKHPCKYCLQESKRMVFSDDIHIFKKKIYAIYGNVFDFECAKYINQRVPISLKCLIHNKVITKEPQVFLKGHGCDLCAKEASVLISSKQTLDEIHDFVKKLNGKCNSITYINNETKLDFECKVGHKFQKSWSAVKNSLRWCPKCSPNKLIGETLTRLILEHLLQLKFPSVYLKEMEGLQLDGYNSENRIAFEYQGYQHYTEKSHFHRIKNRYISQIERDKYKKELCKKNNITLIEIFEFKTIRLSRIQLFVNEVKKKLIELNLNYNNEPFEIDLIELYRGRKSELYEKAKKIVENKNGSIQDFIGAENKHTYTCSKGHKTTNKLLSVIINTKASCAFCDADLKYDYLKKTIESKGGNLIDKKLKPKGYLEKYTWICNNGHKSSTKGQYLINGSWCLECKKTIYKKQFTSNQIKEFKMDVISGNFFQKEIPKKYGISDGVYRRLVSELGLNPNYKIQDRKVQRKITKGKLLQIDPKNFSIVKEFESLESVKHDESGIYKPEGILQQMKKYKKAYGYFWSREEELQKTIKKLKENYTINN